ncbi:Hpt domain-containing protein [Dyadobacter fanqingshengii]|uniref:Hpt domain-containing protein n=1 Tax=Dyadobacter fanqingshengii TaxID=2906443 RepID=A0A9X1PAQ8_9BACT|nr:Hpt domain-containing protein [Dyadobacter fanqingshengii]MCF0041501.1 Hpt domain-containing protein [Dyadobacter fanqingshengii]USJ36780.1 Hpt domain-containing protein [Dyadobacter fanqingshengii]
MMDLSLLKSLMSGDEKLVGHFVSIFKIQVPSQVKALPGLCANEDWEELSITFHSLKSQFSYVGVNDLAEQLREMEERVDNGETGSIAFLISDFTHSFHQFWQMQFPDN